MPLDHENLIPLFQKKDKQFSVKYRMLLERYHRESENISQPSNIPNISFVKFTNLPIPIIVKQQITKDGEESFNLMIAKFS